MKKELRDAWVKALRSGEYTQSQCELKSVTEDDLASYCCLGVMCEVAGKSIPRGAETMDLHHELIVLRDTMELGDFDSDGSYQKRLAVMNDEDGLTFGEIADWIETNMPVST
jgi:hypothetical protein